MIVRAAIILMLIAASAQAQATRPAAQLIWQQHHELRGRHGRMVLLGDAAAGYRVFGSSGFRNEDKSYTQQSWRLSLDPRGRRRDMKVYAAKANESEIRAAVALPAASWPLAPSRTRKTPASSTRITKC